MTQDEAVEWARRWHAEDPTRREVISGYGYIEPVQQRTENVCRNAEAGSFPVVSSGPPCGHSACSQNYIDSGETACVCDEDGYPLIDAEVPNG